MTHIESVQHRSNEAAFGMAGGPGGGNSAPSRFEPEMDASGNRRIRGRGSTKRRFAQVESNDEDSGSDEKMKKDKLMPEPEWKLNPTVTPKGQSYYEHDNRNREDMTFWERKQMFLKTGRYPESGPRGRGGFRGRGGGFRGGRGGRGAFVPAKKFGGEVMDVWKHDKFIEVDNNSQDISDEKDPKEKNDRKDKPASSSKEKSRRVSSSEKKRNEHKESTSDKKSHATSENEAIEKEKREEESLNTEVQVEVT